jgi:hypothetical protein
MWSGILKTTKDSSKTKSRSRMVSSPLPLRWTGCATWLAGRERLCVFMHALHFAFHGCLPCCSNEPNEKRISDPQPDTRHSHPTRTPTPPITRRLAGRRGALPVPEASVESSGWMVVQPAVCCHAAARVARAPSQRCTLVGGWTKLSGNQRNKVLVLPFPTSPSPSFDAHCRPIWPLLWLARCIRRNWRGNTVVAGIIAVGLCVPVFMYSAANEVSLSVSPVLCLCECCVRVCAPRGGAIPRHRRPPRGACVRVCTTRVGALLANACQGTRLSYAARCAEVSLCCAACPFFCWTDGATLIGTGGCCVHVVHCPCARQHSTSMSCGFFHSVVCLRLSCRATRSLECLLVSALMERLARTHARTHARTRTRSSLTPRALARRRQLIAATTGASAQTHHVTTMV